MSDHPTTSRLRKGIGISVVLLLGLGVTVYLLAGRATSPRQDNSAAVTATNPPAATSAPPAIPSTPSSTVSTAPTASPPARVATGRPAAPSRPAAASAPPARRRPAGSLAQAWIAAGARGIDPDATPAPAATSSISGPRPVRIEISTLGVDAPVDPAGTNGDGTLQVPADFARTSYYTGRSAPGDPGPAVIVGHVDGRRGPAVFYRLRDLRAEAEVRIHRADRSVVTFVVERSKHVPKNAFPTDEVYGPTADPTLRLITCSGSFDRRAGHYRDNTIIFLRLKG